MYRKLKYENNKSILYIYTKKNTNDAIYSNRKVIPQDAR